ncbi:hypothetical protein OAA20_00805 [bacterium]|nr:hypothetical protein [bacterium]
MRNKVTHAIRKLSIGQVTLLGILSKGDANEHVIFERSKGTLMLDSLSTQMQRMQRNGLICVCGHSINPKTGRYVNSYGLTAAGTEYIETVKDIFSHFNDVSEENE